MWVHHSPNLFTADLSYSTSQAREVTKNLALIANQYDHDGVDIYFLGGEKFGLRLKVGPVTVVPMYVILTVVLTDNGRCGGIPQKPASGRRGLRRNETG